MSPTSWLKSLLSLKNSSECSSSFRRKLSCRQCQSKLTSRTKISTLIRSHHKILITRILAYSWPTSWRRLSRVQCRSCTLNHASQTLVFAAHSPPRPVGFEFRKTIPPHSLDSLTREYQDQCLVAHLPRDCDPTNIPEWSKRISTRTDYNVIQGVQSTGAARFGEDERFACAYDASGLDVTDIYSEIPRHWRAIKKNATAPRLFACGLTVCLAAVILRNQRGDFSGNRNLIRGATKGGLDDVGTATLPNIMATSVDESNQLPPNKIILALKSIDTPRKQAKTTPLLTVEKLEDKNEQATKLQDSSTTSGSLGANNFVAEDLFALRSKVKTPRPRRPQPPKESFISSEAFLDAPKEERDDRPLLGDIKTQEHRGVKVGCGPRSSKDATSKKKRDKSRTYRSTQVSATPSKRKRFGRIVHRAAESLRALKKEYEALVENDDYIL